MWIATTSTCIYSWSTWPKSQSNCRSQQPGWPELGRRPIKLICLGSSSNTHPNMQWLWQRVPAYCRFNWTAIPPSRFVFLLKCKLLLDLDLLPASYANIKTAFTFSCLDDYRSSNLECKTSAYQYYQKLRRLTNPTFPQAMPNRYNEFHQVTRQWRNLELRKWFGFCHCTETPGKGLLALFCTACPQPGINLSPDFKSWYTECVADCNSYALFSNKSP